MTVIHVTGVVHVTSMPNSSCSRRRHRDVIDLVDMDAQPEPALQELPDHLVLRGEVRACLPAADFLPLPPGQLFHLGKAGPQERE